MGCVSTCLHAGNTSHKTRQTAGVSREGGGGGEGIDT